MFLRGEEFSDLSYDDVVEYPFGYGLSYTTFDWDVKDVTPAGSFDQGTTFEVTVDVTNTGSVAGKDVVEVYYTAPYDAEGSKIQKAGAVLGGFAKTDLIQPGETAEVTISLKAQDMASYDYLRYYSSTGSYVLEKGDYTISVRHNSHDVEDSYDYTLDHSVVFADQDSSTNAENGAVYAGMRDGDQEQAQNRFDDVAGEINYLSRDDWNIVPGKDEEATQEQLDIFSHALDVTEDMYQIDGATEQTMGADNGVTLQDVRGLDYDDPQWDKLLDELTQEDYQNMLATNGWGTAAISKIGKPQIYDMDGPAALSYVFDAFMGTTTYETITYPCEVILASSFNTDLAADFGDAISQEGKAWHISGWYAPGANLHRCAFGGRNFEYYSEDPYLSGAMLTSVVGKATENGMYCYMKHFLMNEMETNRHLGVCTWSNEQAMRELYMKPFEMAVKEGNAAAIMSSYNNLGTTWAGEDEVLLEGVLRGEWGFNGTVLTDNLEQHGFMSTERALIHGGTATLCNGMFASDTIEHLAANASGQIILRNAAHQYLYMLTNSYAMDFGFEQVPALWRAPAIGISAAIYAVSALCLVLLVRKGRKQK